MSNSILHLGIDVSKNSLDLACTIDGQKICASRSVKNNADGFKAAYEYAQQQAQKRKCDTIHVCVEATGCYSDAVVDYFQQLSVKITVANPAQIKAFGKSCLSRTKTDQVDAKLIAFYSARMLPSATPKPSEELRELKKLVRYLDSLIEQRAHQKNQLESATHSKIVESININIAHYDNQIKEIESQIEQHLIKYPDLKKQVDLLQSIPGIGEKTARIILCELQLQDKEYIDPKAQTAHAGLAPSEKRSGTSVHGKPGICKTGNSRLRKCLYLPALVATQHNILISDFYNRLLSKGKLKKVALIACMRKLLVIAIAILNNKTTFDPHWQKKKVAI